MEPKLHDVRLHLGRCVATLIFAALILMMIFACRNHTILESWRTRTRMHDPTFADHYQQFYILFAEITALHMGQVWCRIFYPNGDVKMPSFAAWYFAFFYFLLFIPTLLFPISLYGIKLLLHPGVRQQMGSGWGEIVDAPEDTSIDPMVNSPGTSTIPCDYYGT